MYPRIHAFIYRSLQLFELLVIVVGPITVGLLKADANYAAVFGRWGDTAVTVAQQTAIFWLFFIPISAAVSKTLRSILGEPWFWSHVKFLLDNAATYVFTDHADHPRHHRRATLFRYRRFCCTIRGNWFKGWLVPVVRSGHATKSSIPVFAAPDEADDAEGVAGQAWSKAGTVTVSNLPDITDENCPEAILAVYAEQTYMSLEFVRERRSSSRSIVGIPIEVKSVPWGVIVLDSRSGTPIDDDRIAALSALTVKPLVKLIEKGIP